MKLSSPLTYHDQAGYPRVGAPLSPSKSTASSPKSRKLVTQLSKPLVSPEMNVACVAPLQGQDDRKKLREKRQNHDAVGCRAPSPAGLRASSPAGLRQTQSTATNIDYCPRWVLPVGIRKPLPEGARRGLKEQARHQPPIAEVQPDMKCNEDAVVDDLQPQELSACSVSEKSIYQEEAPAQDHGLDADEQCHEHEIQRLSADSIILTEEVDRLKRQIEEVERRQSRFSICSIAMLDSEDVTPCQTRSSGSSANLVLGNADDADTAAASLLLRRALLSRSMAHPVERQEHCASQCPVERDVDTHLEEVDEKFKNGDTSRSTNGRSCSSSHRVTFEEADHRKRNDTADAEEEEEEVVLEDDGVDKAHPAERQEHGASHCPVERDVDTHLEEVDEKFKNGDTSRSTNRSSCSSTHRVTFEEADHRERNDTADAEEQEEEVVLEDDRVDKVASAKVPLLRGHPIVIDEQQEYAEREEIWDVGLAYSLGPTIGRPDNGAIQRLDAGLCASVSKAVEMLNSGALTCADGICIVYSNTHRGYYLLGRADKKRDCMQLARDTFQIAVQDDQDDALERILGTAAKRDAQGNDATSELRPTSPFGMMTINEDEEWEEFDVNATYTSNTEYDQDEEHQEEADWRAEHRTSSEIGDCSPSAVVTDGTPRRRTVHPLAELKTRRSVAAKELRLEPASKETHLDDDTFEGHFGMPRAEFYSMPKWKQQDAKKSVGIF